jgi:phospholipid/cholesterol/gamma-HCH transport system ATP-binding protein
MRAVPQANAPSLLESGPLNRPTVPGSAARAGELDRSGTVRCLNEHQYDPFVNNHSGPAVSPAAAPSPAIAVLRDVHYAVDSGKSVFNGLDIEIRRGAVTAIMGPSGTGKTTLLRLITGQICADHGQVVVDNLDLARLDRREIYALRRRMGMLFQNGALLTDLDVFENVAFPLREHTKLPERLIRTIVLTKLHAVGLRGATNLYPQQLSGGMARRVALARAIAMDPDILIYDEPFAGLDPISMGVVLRLIRSLNDALGITSIVVTHDVREISQIADASFILSDGKVVASGTTAELRDHPSPIVHQFVEGLADGPVSFHYHAQLLGGRVFA